MKQVPISLLDNRNTQLWLDLNKLMQISLEIGNYESFANLCKNDNATIYIPKEKMRDASGFTHELLHIYLWTKEVYFGSGLKRYVRNGSKLKIFLSEQLIEHISNCLSHIKMFPLYIDLGYKEEGFIQDYHKCKFSEYDMQFLKKNYLKSPLFGGRYYSKEGVQQFIGRYISAKCCPNKRYNYFDKYKFLKDLDSTLFIILEELIDQWNEYNIEEKDIVSGGYIELMCRFIYNLEKWTYDKLIK